MVLLLFPPSFAVHTNRNQTEQRAEDDGHGTANNDAARKCQDGNDIVHDGDCGVLFEGLKK